LNGRPDGDYRIQRYSAKIHGRIPAQPFRRPFWLSASNYYILATAVTIAFFFLVWGIMHEGNEDMPWMVAGIGASLVLGSAVVMREIFLRKARNRYLLAERTLGYNVRNFPIPPRSENRRKQTHFREKTRQSLKAFRKKAKPRGFWGKFQADIWKFLKFAMSIFR
jgi:hypothetical protein